MKYAQEVMDKELTVRGEYYLTEGFMLMIRDGMKLYVEDVDVWLDVGTIPTILDTNAKLLNGAIWKGKSVVIQDSILGENVSINDNTVIKNSTINNAIIGKNSLLDGVEVNNSIIGDNVTLKKNGTVHNIGDNCTIE